MVPNLAFGDAVGNDILAIDRLLRAQGYHTKIMAKVVDPKLKSARAEIIKEVPRLNKNDILIHHLANGDELLKQLPVCDAKIVFRFHNITPAEYYFPYDANVYSICKKGREQLKEVNSLPDYCIADSDYNKQDLVNLGYRCPIEVNPVLVPLEDYDKQPNKAVVEKYNDGWVNIIFVGRIAPNKKQEDVIKTFSWYKKHLNNKSRLFLVGGDSTVKYTQRLKEYVEFLGSDDIYFTGKIPFVDILAYYRIASVFLCMSEHEGFCVPLVEAMKFHIPIVARSSSAIPYTLGNAGVIIKDNNPVIASLAIERVLDDESFRNTIIKRQDERLSYFSYDNVGSQFLRIIDRIRLI